MNNPAKAIIDKFGGVPVVAQICHVHISRVHRWMYPKEKGGSDGIIPTKRQDLLLAAAPSRGIDLSRDEFFHSTAKQPTEPRQ